MAARASARRQTAAGRRPAAAQVRGAVLARVQACWLEHIRGLLEGHPPASADGSPLPTPCPLACTPLVQRLQPPQRRRRQSPGARGMPKRCTSCCSRHVAAAQRRPAKPPLPTWRSACGSRSRRCCCLRRSSSLRGLMQASRRLTPSGQQQRVRCWLPCPGQQLQHAGTRPGQGHERQARRCTGGHGGRRSSSSTQGSSLSGARAAGRRCRRSRSVRRSMGRLHGCSRLACLHHR